MSRTTPGPWRVNSRVGVRDVTGEAFETIHIGSADGGIALALKGSELNDGSQEANAHLIAAAPQLAQKLGWAATQLEAVDDILGEILDGEPSLPAWVRENLTTRMVNARSDAKRAREALSDAFPDDCRHGCGKEFNGDKTMQEIHEISCRKQPSIMA